MPGYVAGDVGWDLLSLPSHLDGALDVADERGDEGKVVQGKRLPGRVAELLGHGQRTAAVIDRLGGPPHVHQYSGPAGQAVSQRPGRLPPDAGQCLRTVSGIALLTHASRMNEEC